MLLSCTVAMGADTKVAELEITKDNNGKIEFKDENGESFTPESENKNNPYPDNNWNASTNTYTNNSVISGTSDAGTVTAGNTAHGAGLKVSDTKINLVNNGEINGEITGTTTGNGEIYGYGIYVDSDLNGNLTNNGKITGTGAGTATSDPVATYGYGIYVENLKGKLENNGNITATGNQGGYGIRVANLTGELTNNGEITATATATSKASYGYGIRMADLTGELTNNGKITSTVTSTSGSSYGIRVADLNGNLTNNGEIIAAGMLNSYGIRINSNLNATGNLINNGNIISTATGTQGGAGGIFINLDLNGNLINNGITTATGGRTAWGIYIDSDLNGNLTNNGIITATTCGIMQNKTSDSNHSNIINKGVIYGKASAILTKSKASKSLSNYGLLVTGGDKVIDGKFTTTNNYGLAFKVEESGTYSAKDEVGDSDFSNFGTISGDSEYTVINAKAEGTNNTDITGTDSLTFKEGTLSYKNSGDTTKEENIDSSKKYVLNGITDTLVVSTGDNKLSNSVINAYGTAVKFDTNGGKLTLVETIVNGGLDGSDVVVGSDKSDNLVLQGKSIINGNIVMGEGNDTLTIGSGAVINGTLNGGKATTSASPVPITTFATENNTLNFGTADSSSGEETRILHDISGFESININSKVTFYEKTVKADNKTAKGLEVTGVSDLTIGKNGVLTLRIDGANSNSHALSSGNTGTISSKEGGKLLLALNGVGNSATVSFGDLTLDDSLKTGHEADYQRDVTLETTSVLHSVKRETGTNNLEITARVNLPYSPVPDNLRYEKLNEIYHSIVSVEDLLENFNVDDEGLVLFLDYLNNIYAGNPYSYSSELSRKSAGMFRDIVVDNIFRPEKDKWMIYGGLTHVDGGTKDTYYGKGYYTTDIGSSDMDADTKITGAYMLGEYGVSDTLTSGVVIGGNKLKSDLSNGSKVDGSAMYLGAYAKKYIGNLKVTAGAGFQYGDYDADRLAVNKVASDSAESVMKYSDNYNDITYDIYLNGRYSHNIGNNLFLEPYATLSYTYIDQDGANEGNKTLAIETDSKSFDYTVGKAGVDLKKVILHEKGKSTLSAGVSYTKILDGADEEHITGRFKGGSDFDILVAHKNEHSIGLNAKYALELENGVIFDVKGTYSIERDSHNGSGKNRTKGEWIVGAGLGYKF